MDKDKIENHLFKEKIDTSTAEKNFEKLLNQKKTFFLNGSWGSGKTQFIEKVKKRATKHKGNEKKKLMLLDLWRVNNNSIFTSGFRSLSPFWFIVSRVFIIIILCSFIMFTGIVNVPKGMEYFSPTKTHSSLFTAFFSNSNTILPYLKLILLIFILPLSVGVSISKYLGLKIDQLDHFLLEKISLKNKVLVVDDFDRLTSDQQKEGYKLFTFLKDKIPIVFLGDYQRLVNGLEENYLIKVIDQRVELPFVLHPTNIWRTYFSFLESDLNVTLSDEITELFINENRNLRDRDQFQAYVYQEFYTNGKKGSVQVEEQLLIIYIYLFNNEVYQTLLSGIKTGFSKDELGKNIRKMLDEKTQEFPLHFAVNSESYFIFESITNASYEQMQFFLTDEKHLQQQFEESYTVGVNDFMLFVRASLSKFSSDESENLLKYTVKYFKKYGFNSPLTSFVIDQNSDRIATMKSLVPRNRIFGFDVSKPGTNDELTDLYFDGWSKLLNREKFDCSAKINFFITNNLISYPDLANKYDKMNYIVTDFTTSNYPVEILLMYLSSEMQWYDFKAWSDDVWSVIEKLSKSEFKRFCMVQNISPKDTYSHFTLAKFTTDPIEGWISLNPEYVQDNNLFLNKMKEKIEELSIEVIEEG